MVPEGGHVLHGDLVVLVLDECRRFQVEDLLQSLADSEPHLWVSKSTNSEEDHNNQRF